MGDFFTNATFRYHINIIGEFGRFFNHFWGRVAEIYGKTRYKWAFYFLRRYISFMNLH